MPIRAAVFDLDDTLYLERQYVRSGYKHVSDLLTRDDAKRRELFDFLWDLFKEEGSQDAFEMLYDEYPEICNGRTADDLLDAFHDHTPNINLMPRVGSLLDKLHTRGVHLGIIADGSPVAQERKIEALGLSGKLDQVVFTESWGEEYRKPHERAFREMTSHLQLRANELAYVADDPEKDFRAPNALGWKTVRLRLPYQIRFAAEYEEQEDKPSLVISDIRALQAFLEEACEIGDR